MVVQQRTAGLRVQGMGSMDECGALLSGLRVASQQASRPAAMHGEMISASQLRSGSARAYQDGEDEAAEDEDFARVFVLHTDQDHADDERRPHQRREQEAEGAVEHDDLHVRTHTCV